jgi:L-amino acid N-acyltransferase YncA
MVEIRPARPEDARAIARVHVAAWQAAYRGILPDEMLEEMSVEEREATWTNILTAYAATHPVLAAEEFGVGLVGFGNAGPLRGEPVAGYGGEFKTLYVLPAFQRRGIGGRLLRGLAAELVARGHGAALAWVLADNPAGGFFAAMGGVVCAERVEEVEDMALEDVAYGWPALGALAGRADS